MATTDDGNHPESDSAESDDLSKPTAPSRPSRLPALTPAGVPIAVAIAIVFGLATAMVLIQRTKASRMAVVAATAAAAAAKARPAPAAPDDPQKPDPPAHPEVKEPALREQLLKRMKAEQDARVEVMRLNPAHKLLTPEDRQRPEVKAAFEKMEKVDQDNLAWLKGVVEKHGWPGKSQVGRDGAQGAFLIAQHAVGDLDFMAKCLGLLKEAYQAGEADGQWVALITDRLLVLREKKKQRYGTQLMPKGGKLVPQPIEDEANVDKRRKELGMPPLADYLKMVNDRQGSPVKQPDANSAPPKKG